MKKDVEYLRRQDGLSYGDKAVEAGLHEVDERPSPLRGSCPSTVQYSRMVRPCHVLGVKAGYLNVFCRHYVVKGPEDTPYYGKLKVWAFCGHIVVLELVKV